MSETFAVLWAAVAGSDLVGIILRIAEESPGNAEKATLVGMWRTSCWAGS